MASLKDMLKPGELPKDILEPGETVILRMPGGPLWLPAVMFSVGLLNALPAALRLTTGSENLVDDIVFIASGIFMFAVGILLYRLFRIWRLLVTDRRLLHRFGSVRGQLPRQGRLPYEEIPLAGIDEVKPYRLGDGLFVTGRGLKVVIPCKEKYAARIRAAIEAARGAV